MKEYYRVMTFQSNGMPIQMENKKWNTEQEAKQRMEELKKIHSVPLYVSKTNGGN